MHFFQKKLISFHPQASTGHQRCYQGFFLGNLQQFLKPKNSALLTMQAIIKYYLFPWSSLHNHSIYAVCVIMSSVLDSVSCPHAVPCHGEHCGAADRVDKADTVTMIMTEYREAEGRNIPQQVNYRHSQQLSPLIIMVTCGHCRLLQETLPAGCSVGGPRSG